MPTKLHLYRNKEKMRNYRNRNRKANYEKGRIYNTKSSKLWTDIEDFILVKLSETDNNDRYIAKVLGRSVQAIQARRYRLNKEKKDSEKGDL